MVVSATVSSRSASFGTRTWSSTAGGGSQRRCGTSTSASAPIAPARRGRPANARPPTTTGCPTVCAAATQSAAPRRLTGTVHDSASTSMSRISSPPAQMLCWHRRTEHGDVRPGLGGDRGRHAGRQRVPFALGTGNRDVRAVVELPTDGHDADRRYCGLGNGGRRVLLGDGPLAPLPQLPDVRLRRRENVLDDLAQ